MIPVVTLEPIPQAKPRDMGYYNSSALKSKSRRTVSSKNSGSIGLRESCVNEHSGSCLRIPNSMEGNWSQESEEKRPLAFLWVSGPPSCSERMFDLGESCSVLT